MAAIEEIAPGLHRWTARHPSWHPSDAFGAEVAGYALAAGDGLLLIDPLVPDVEDADGGADAVLAGLDALSAAAGTTAILITIGYHVRSAAALAARYAATIHGPANAGKRIDGPDAFTLLEPGAPGPAGVVAHAIGRPRRGEAPIWLPSHDAIAFGDALVTTPDGELRMWCQEPRSADRVAFYRDRFAPTLAPLVARRPARVLTTHGPPILHDAAGALARAVAAAEPWFHHG